IPAVWTVAPDRSPGRISRRSLWSGILYRLEPERNRVDAPPLVRRHIVTFTFEHVPKMEVAVGAPYLGPDAAERTVLEQDDGVAFLRLVEARPAAMRLELGVRSEQLRTARAAYIDAAGLRVNILAGERGLNAGLAQDVILLRCEPLAPFVF